VLLSWEVDYLVALTILLPDLVALREVYYKRECYRWRGVIGCLIFICHFPQKSPEISGSFANDDLQLLASYGSSPPCTWLHDSRCLPVFVPDVRAVREVYTNKPCHIRTHHFSHETRISYTYHGECVLAWIAGYWRGNVDRFLHMWTELYKTHLRAVLMRKFRILCSRGLKLRGRALLGTGAGRIISRAVLSSTMTRMMAKTTTRMTTLMVYMCILYTYARLPYVHESIKIYLCICTYVYVYIYRAN